MPNALGKGKRLLPLRCITLMEIKETTITVISNRFADHVTRKRSIGGRVESSRNHDENRRPASFSFSQKSGGYENWIRKFVTSAFSR